MLPRARGNSQVPSCGCGHRGAHPPYGAGSAHRERRAPRNGRRGGRHRDGEPLRLRKQSAGGRVAERRSGGTNQPAAAPMRGGCWAWRSPPGRGAWAGRVGGLGMEMAPLGDTDGAGDRGRWYKRGGRLGPAPTDDGQVLNHSTRLQLGGTRWHSRAVGQAAHPLPPLLCPPQAPPSPTRTQGARAYCWVTDPPGARAGLLDWMYLKATNTTAVQPHWATPE